MNLKGNGIVNMLIATLCLATMGALTKKLGQRFPSVELVFFRNLIGTVILGVSFYANPVRQQGGKFGMLAFRGFIGTMSLFAFFYCLTKLNLAIANTYNLTYPIFIGLISGFVLLKPLKKVQWLGIGLGFAGILLIFRPDLSFPVKFHVLGLFSGFGTSLGYLSINHLHEYYDRRVIVLSFLLTGLTVSVISMLVGLYYQNPELDFVLAPFVHPMGREWALILAMGSIALLGQTFITRAFSFGKPSVVGPINYMQIVFAMGFGVLLGDFFPDLLSMAGMALIISSGVLMTIYSTKMD